MARTSLIKHYQVKYVEQQCRDLASPDNDCGPEPSGDIVNAEGFCIYIKRNHGTVLGIKIVHDSGDSVSLDFHYPGSY